MHTDFYELLDIPHDASQKTITNAYLDKVHEYHPDKNRQDPEAQAKLDLVRIAYETVSDPSKRDAYSDLGHDEFIFMAYGRGERLNDFPDVEGWELTDIDVEQDTTVTIDPKGLFERDEGENDC